VQDFPPSFFLPSRFHLPFLLLSFTAFFYNTRVKGFANRPTAAVETLAEYGFTLALTPALSPRGEGETLSRFRKFIHR
jgi:hypothetical protein